MSSEFLVIDNQADIDKLFRKKTAYNDEDHFIECLRKQPINQKYTHQGLELEAKLHNTTTDDMIHHWIRHIGMTKNPLRRGSRHDNEAAKKALLRIDSDCKYLVTPQPSTVVKGSFYKFFTFWTEESDRRNKKDLGCPIVELNKCVFLLIEKGAHEQIHPHQEHHLDIRLRHSEEA